MIIPKSNAMGFTAFLLICMASLFFLLVHRQGEELLDLPFGWWVFTDIRGTSYFFKRRDDLDATGTHSCYESYSSLNSTLRSFCYPNLILSGYAKSGTSNLHQVIKAYSNNTHTLPKELCPAAHFNRSLLQFLFHTREAAYALNEEFFKWLPKEAKTSEGQNDDLIIFSSCIDVNLNLFADKVLRHPHSIYIFLVRDYADWLWSAYNYWCNPRVDESCSESRWTEVGVHVRSPELFDNYVRVKSDFKSTMVLNPSWFWFGEDPCYHGGRVSTITVSLTSDASLSLVPFF